MPWFRCFIRGENFPDPLAPQDVLAGFYVTRFVKARNAAEAETRALEVLRADPRLAPPAGYQPKGIARVHFEEIEAITRAEVPDPQPGFAWYPMDSDGPRG